MESQFKKYKNTLDNLYRNLVLSCETCGGRDEYCSCKQKFKIYKDFASANIPLKHFLIELNDIVDEGLVKIKRVVEHFVNDLDDNIRKGRCFLFYSKYQGGGSGKTSLGCIILKEAIRRGYSGYFLTMNECINMYKDTFNKNYEQQILRSKLEYVDVLVIDDLTQAKTWAYDFLHSIIQERCNNLKVTILTSNFDANKQGEGERIIGNTLFLYIKEHMEYLEFNNGPFGSINDKKKRRLTDNARHRK